MNTTTYEAPHPFLAGITRTLCVQCNKVVFPAQAQADGVADRLSHKLESYRGPCGHWHLTRARR